MIHPIGTFLTKMDAALTGSMGGIIASMTSAMATPIAVSAIIYYAVQGLRLANGDSTPLQNFVPQLIRVGTVIWLSSNLGAFNQWVTNIFFTGLPNALAAAIGTGTGNPANSLGATAATFDNIAAQVWVMVGTIWGQVSFSAMGIVAALAGLLAALFGYLCLAFLVLVYECARMVLAVIVCLAPVIIGCAMFDATRPIFERAVGKVVALILLQTAGLIVLQIVLMGDQWFVAQANTAFFNAMASGGAQLDDLQILIALPVWFLAGTFAMYSLPAVAYSIGSGITISGPPLLLWYHLARSMLGNGGKAGVQPAAGGGALPPLNVSIAPRESGGDFAALLPPPPPPSIATSTRR
jgi:type IV secretion system protein VirB6